MPDVVMGQPLSRTEAILQNMLGANNVLEPPMSREEYLLLQLLNHIGPSGDYYTKEEIDNMISALEQEIDWKESVATFADLATTYPDAEAGWTASVLADGRIYRYNGTAWIDIYGMIPLATSSVNGLMSSGKVIDLETIKTLLNGHSVASDVPANAVFTDTVYDDTALSGRVTVVEGLLDSHSVASDVPANAVFTDTVYDDTALSGRVSVVEGLLDSHSVGKDVPSDAKFTDTVYDDTELSNRVTELENDTVSKTATGNPISITDAADAPIASGEVAFEPKQDLHGYDKPWAGGAGKNKLPLVLAEIKAANTTGTWSGNTYTKNGVSFTVLVDSGNNVICIRMNGTASEETSFVLASNSALQVLAGLSLKLNGSTGGDLSTYGLRAVGWNGTNTSGSFDGDSITFTPTTAFNYVEVRIFPGYTASNIAFYPMIRLATETDATFAPYSNICPIMGYDDCEVEVTGKNFLPSITTQTQNGVTLTQNADGSITLNGTATATTYFDFYPNGDFDSNKYAGYRLTLGSAYTEGTTATVIVRISKSSTRPKTQDLTANNMAIIDNDNNLYLAIRIAQNYTINNVTYYPMLYKPTDTDAYEPYQSKTYTIDLDGTRYGGKVDLVSGVMRVDRAIVDMGNLDWRISSLAGHENFYATLTDAKAPVNNNTKANILSEIYQLCTSNEIYEHVVGNSLIALSVANMLYVYDMRYTDASTYKTAMNGVKFCYELATPFTVQLTPEQIRTLEGTNNISTNMTDMSLEYITQDYQPLVDLANDTLIIAKEYTDEQISLLKKKVYGMRITGNAESDPASKITYLDDAVGMTPAYMDYTTGKFNFGSWADAWFMDGIKPCVLNADGTVYCYLDRNDQTKDVDGNDVTDIVNGTTDFGQNCMVEWPKIWIKTIPVEGDDTSGLVYIAPMKLDDDYHDFPYIDQNGNHKEHFYRPMYNGSVKNGVMRSLLGQQVSKSLNTTTEISYCQANGDGWYTETAGEIMLVNFLLMLISKSTDTQTVFGKGLSENGSEAINDAFRTGVHSDKGMFYGTKSAEASTYTNAVKVFYTENDWGFQWRRYAGDINASGTRKAKMCWGTEDGSTVANYNTDGAGYVDVGATPSGTSGGYINEMKFTSLGMFSKTSSGSSSTHYCDGQWFNNNQTDYAIRGGSSGDGAHVGAFCVGLHRAPSSAGWYIGAALSYK